MSPVPMKTPRRAPSRPSLGVHATAEETLAALRAAHADGVPVPVTSLPVGLYAAILQHFGSITAAREQLGIAPPDRARLWSQAKVLTELRRLFRSGVELTAANLRNHRGLLGAIANHVGSLREARTLAGLPDPERKSTTPANVWDDLEVVRVIEQRARNGEPLAASQVPTALYTAARKHWGTWARAIEAAGLDYASIRRVRATWTKAEIVFELGRLRAARPALTRTELSLCGLGQACVSEFGSLDQALAAAQLTGWPRHLKARLVEVSPDAIRASLRALARRGVPLTIPAIASEDPRLLRSIRRTIPGPWSKVLTTLGLDDPTPRWDRGRVLAELREAHARGEALNARANSKLAARARYHFGSLTKAVEALGDGATIRPHVRRSREDVLDELRQLGRGGSHVPIRRAGRALASAAFKHFGSWRRACEAAGVEPGPPGRRRPATRKNSRAHQ